MAESVLRTLNVFFVVVIVIAGLCIWAAIHDDNETTDSRLFHAWWSILVSTVGWAITNGSLLVAELLRKLIAEIRALRLKEARPEQSRQPASSVGPPPVARSAVGPCSSCGKKAELRRVHESHLCRACQKQLFPETLGPEP